MRMFWTLAVLVMVQIAPGRAFAGPILERIKSTGVVKCGGVERPGLIEIEDDAKASGLELDICRAIAFAVLGANGKIEFTRYDSEMAFDKVRAGADDVSFLTGAEIINNGLAGKIIPGPAVFQETVSMMVREDSPFIHAQDLAGRPICFSLLHSGRAHLEDWFASRNLPMIRMGFQEDVEMNDAYAVQYCKAIVGEVTTLAETRLSSRTAEYRHRLLPESFAIYPIVAATSTIDGQWASIVAWTIGTLMRADAPVSDWVVGGVDSLRIHASELGLAEGWQKNVVGAIGSYLDMYDRNLGERSPFKLPRGLNAGQEAGGSFSAPYSD